MSDVFPEEPISEPGVTDDEALPEGRGDGSEDVDEALVSPTAVLASLNAATAAAAGPISAAAGLAADAQGLPSNAQAASSEELTALVPPMSPGAAPTAPAYVAPKGAAAAAADRSAFSVSRPEDKPKAQIKLAPLPCGIVLFDHPDEMGGGTAYLPNTPAQRIRSANDLRNNVLWVSNLMATEDRIRHHPNLRSGYYLRVALAEIAHDMGVQCSREGQMAPDDAQHISVIMTRIMTIAARAYGWDVAELGPLMVQEPFLMKDIAHMLPSAPAPDQRFRETFMHALTQSYQDASAPDWPTPTFEPDSVYVTLRYNRQNYVQQMLDFPLPKGSGWVYMDGVNVQSSILDYCIERPTLVKATIEWDNTSSDLAALCAFGQAGKRRATMRHWMAQPELAWLSQYAKVTITSLWVDQSGYTRLPIGARLPSLFTAHPEACLSYSAGLVAHNHWLALSSMTWSKKLRREESNLWATWLRAMDRAWMFSKALQAYEAGFHVDYYGAGSLRLRVTRDRLVELAQFKEQHGFMYPDVRSLLQREMG